MLKEDHHQRYDFPGAPHLPVNWWECTFNDEEQSFELVATKPMEVVEEGEYLEMVKPKIEKVMGEIMVEEMEMGTRAGEMGMGMGW